MAQVATHAASRKAFIGAIVAKIIYKEPPHRSKVASHDASHGTALFGAAHVDADECLDSALASVSVAGCAVDFAAAFVDDAAATRSDPCRYDADRVFRGDGTGSKTFSQDALPSAVGAFKVVLRYPTRVLLLLLAVARALRAPVLFGSGRGLADALTMAGGDAPAAAARLDFALLQLRELQGRKRERNSQLQSLISRPFSTRFG